MQSRTPRRPEKSSKLTQQRNNTCWQLSIRTEASPDCASGNEVARPPRNGRASNTWTRNPAPPSAAAAERPANPPPITIALGISGHALRLLHFQERVGAASVWFWDGVLHGRAGANSHRSVFD